MNDRGLIYKKNWGARWPGRWCRNIRCIVTNGQGGIQKKWIEKIFIGKNTTLIRGSKNKGGGGGKHKW